MTRRPDLVSDCTACAALCCIATSFSRSEDFAFDKPAGVRCRYLTRRSGCAIHDDLVGRGCLGCAVYDCHGAGPRATRAFAAEPAPVRDRAFLVLRELHELLWLLTEASQLCPPSCGDLVAELGAQIETLDALAHSTATQLLELPLGPHEQRTRSLLRRVGDAIGGRARTRRTALAIRPRDQPADER